MDPGFLYEAKRIPNLHDIAKVAVAIIPRRFEAGLFIGRVENGEGHAGYIAAEFAVGAKLHVFGVVLCGRDIGVAHRAGRLFLGLQTQTHRL